MYEAVILWTQRDLGAASSMFAEIQETTQTYGFDWEDAFCCFFLGSDAWLAGDTTQAYEHYNRSLEISRRVGDLTIIAWTLIALANVSLKSGELEEATRLYEQCLAIWGEQGDRHGVGAVLIGLGMAAHFRGDMDEAQSLLAEAQTSLREGGGGQEISWPLSNVPVDTSTSDLLLEVTDRYQAALTLPPAEWAQMVFSDGEAWRAL
jgi:tetratricopeptide (TPR) repeat protein